MKLAPLLEDASVVFEDLLFGPMNRSTPFVLADKLMIKKDIQSRKLMHLFVPNGYRNSAEILCGKLLGNLGINAHDDLEKTTCSECLISIQGIIASFQLLALLSSY